MSGHGKSPGYSPGNHWFTCDVCGFDYPADQARKRWDNLWVCKYDWEPRQTQDFVRGRKDKISPDDPIRPPPNDVFLARENVDTSAVVGCAIVGLAIVGIFDPHDHKIPVGTFGEASMELDPGQYNTDYSEEL